MAKILCISGPASTGKTTLLNLIQNQELPYNIKYVPELIRTFIDRDEWNKIKNIPEKMFDLQWKMSRYLIRQYNEYLIDKSDIVLLDRAPIDFIVYTLIQYSLLEKMTQIIQIRLFNITNALKELTDKVTRIYQTQVNDNTFIPEDDGFRPDIYLDQRQVEIDLFNEINIGNKIILPDDNNERVNIIVNDIHKIMEL